MLANKSNCADSNRRETDSDNQITLVKAMTALNIWLIVLSILERKAKELIETKLLLSKFPSTHCHLEINFCRDLWTPKNFVSSIAGQFLRNSTSTCVREESFNLNKQVEVYFCSYGVRLRWEPFPHSNARLALRSLDMLRFVIATLCLVMLRGDLFYLTVRESVNSSQLRNTLFFFFLFKFEKQGNRGTESFRKLSVSQHYQT